jgi:hypothetical protein
MKNRALVKDYLNQNAACSESSEAQVPVQLVEGVVPEHDDLVAGDALGSVKDQFGYLLEVATGQQVSIKTTNQERIECLVGP